MHRSLPRQRAAVISAGDAILPAAAARLARLLARALRESVAVAEAVAFWTAALLPLAYLPLLVPLQYVPLDSILVGVVGVVHLITLVVGHHHDPTRVTSDTAPQTGSD